MFTAKVSGDSRGLGFKVAVAFLAPLFVVILGSGLFGIDVSEAGGPKFCSRTAKRAFRACYSEAQDDYWITRGNCINLEDPQERRECYKEAKEQFKEAEEECRDQWEARLEVCDLVGEERYDPDFDPDNFISDGDDIVGNNYFPLAVGNRWVYEGGGERITVEVLEETKLIEGVTCRVVNDRVVDEEDKVIEDTDDWYAQHNVTNDIWYCGEIAQNYELFEGDIPDDPELVDIDGSWKAGRDCGKPGILIEADPQPGHAYRQELLLGDAEDVAEVLSNTYVFGGDTENSDSLDYQVPEDLATLLCSAGSPCVVTRDLTALEPGVEERKYYAPGIGVFLEVNLETGDIVQLVWCNVDATKCASLPTP